MLITYKALNGLAPTYILEMLSPLKSVRTLRSSEQALLEVPHTKFVTRGDRAFAARAPRLWNALPVQLRLAPSVSLFKSCLKTHLFTKHFL